MATCTLDYWINDGWFVGRLRENPGVFSQGKTLEELKHNIEDALELMLEEAPLPVTEYESVGRKAPVPRHQDVKNSLVALICRQLGVRRP